VNRRLSLEGVGKSYGRHLALQQVNADWAEGTAVALVGANGGGKSTLLKILAGVVAADCGTISGLETFTTAFVPDKLAFSRGWTARSWLTLVASWKKAPAGRIDSVLQEAGLLEAASKPVATFSQGMLRRLLYAQTRLTDADLMLLDEPEGGLDPQWLVRLEGELARLKGEGRTLIFSTHLVDLAVEFADELVVFAAGRVVATEPASLWAPLDSAERRHRLSALIGTP